MVAAAAVVNQVARATGIWLIRADNNLLA